ncbi:futalosine hydrolase [Chitinophaga horti]|uniref:Futalosine hydrolase n=1 Tax=Chitinophaga horti TaxID=2920382 RepID=A0ABY6J1F4_9BACT|nr:futalosine hydrolase [Chitinophaga horti]UYQ93492.1 futalosine hydrolase [Chitinophaga horti]
MKILVTAATAAEIGPFIAYLEEHGQQIAQHTYTLFKNEIHVLPAGIGMMHTAYHVGKALLTVRPDLAIQAGIAGCFHHDWPLGEVVLIHEEVLGDLGVEEKDAYKDLFDTGLWKENTPPFQGRSLFNPIDRTTLRRAKSVTINTVTGTQPTIDKLAGKYAPDIESMEGAAFHYICLSEGVPFLQLRSISNYVEIRDKSKWNIPLAIKNLNQALIHTLKELTDQKDELWS